MVTVPIKDEYVEVLTVFGNLEAAIDLALQRYTIEQITAKMAELRQKDAAYQAKYKMDYPTFAQRAAKNEKFIEKIETTNKLWEVDLADWEFCHKGIEDWSRKLQSILLG
ncbi:MAG: hypothetical protein HS114_37435 [Anaerolineales bacterium]|nr:hypothetical protein [Anaerolineales bacterium]